MKLANDPETHQALSKILIGVYIVLSTFLNFYLIGEIKTGNEILKEEIGIKYEYSLVIDSLLNELEHGRIHYNESIGDAHSEWEYKRGKGIE